MIWRHVGLLAPVAPQPRPRDVQLGQGGLQQVVGAVPVAADGVGDAAQVDLAGGDELGELRVARRLASPRPAPPAYCARAEVEEAPRSSARRRTQSSSAGDVLGGPRRSCRERDRADVAPVRRRSCRRSRRAGSPSRTGPGLRRRGRPVPRSRGPRRRASARRSDAGRRWWRCRLGCRGRRRRRLLGALASVASRVEALAGAARRTPVPGSLRDRRRAVGLDASDGTRRADVGGAVGGVGRAGDVAARRVGPSERSRPASVDGGRRAGPAAGWTAGRRRRRRRGSATAVTAAATPAAAPPPEQHRRRRSARRAGSEAVGDRARGGALAEGGVEQLAEEVGRGVGHTWSTDSVRPRGCHGAAGSSAGAASAAR